MPADWNRQEKASLERPINGSGRYTVISAKSSMAGWMSLDEANKTLFDIASYKYLKYEYATYIIYVVGN